MDIELSVRLEVWHLVASGLALVYLLGAYIVKVHGRDLDMREDDSRGMYFLFSPIAVPITVAGWAATKTVCFIGRVLKPKPRE